MLWSSLSSGPDAGSTTGLVGVDSVGSGEPPDSVVSLGEPVAETEVLG